MTAISLKQSFLLYTALFALFTFPYWGQGKVLAPNRQMLELGLKPIPAEHQTEGRLFGDYNDTFIPAVTEHLKEPRSGWLALWSNENGLGHPLYHLSGLSPAYAPSWVISQITSNPWRFMTILCLSICFLAGVFTLLLCVELGLSPFAAAVAGVCLCVSPVFVAAIEFPMILAAWCWTAGILWSLTRMARRWDLLSWCVLSFGVYSLLITSRPQLVVFNAYIAIPYGLYLLYRLRIEQPQNVWKFLSLTASAVLVGVTLTFPIYLDLYHVFSQSVRSSAPPTFYLAYLPKFGSWTSNLSHLITNFIPTVFGDLQDPHYPFKHIGLRLTPLLLALPMVALFCSFKRTWGWWVCILVINIITFIHPLYLFAVEHLGFGMERSNPLICLMLPLAILTAYGVDDIFRRSGEIVTTRAVLFAAGVLFAIVAYAMVLAKVDHLHLEWPIVVLSLLLAFLIGLQSYRTRLWEIVLSVVIVTEVLVSPALHQVDPTSIATESRLTDTLRANMPEGSRFAFIDNGSNILLPNVNAGLGLPSVHNYDPLSPRRYSTLIASLGGKVQVQGRWNTAISPDFRSDNMWMSNISVLLSTTPLAVGGLTTEIGREAGLYIYGFHSRMGDAFLADSSHAQITGSKVWIDHPEHFSGGEVKKSQDRGDEVFFDLKAGTPSILILSHLFDSNWHATALGPTGWKPIKTVEVNGVFQGVDVPANVQRVRLEYKPYVRFAWISSVIWLALFALLAIRAGLQKLLPHQDPSNPVSAS